MPLGRSACESLSGLGAFVVLVLKSLRPQPGPDQSQLPLRASHCLIKPGARTLAKKAVQEHPKAGASGCRCNKPRWWCAQFGECICVSLLCLTCPCRGSWLSRYWDPWGPRAGVLASSRSTKFQGASDTWGGTGTGLRRCPMEGVSSPAWCLREGLPLACFLSGG